MLICVMCMTAVIMLNILAGIPESVHSNARLHTALCTAYEHGFHKECAKNGKIATQIVDIIDAGKDELLGDVAAPELSRMAQVCGFPDTCNSLEPWKNHVFDGKSLLKNLLSEFISADTALSVLGGVGESLLNIVTFGAATVVKEAVKTGKKVNDAAKLPSPPSITDYIAFCKFTRDLQVGCDSDDIMDLRSIHMKANDLKKNFRGSCERLRDVTLLPTLHVCSSIQYGFPIGSLSPIWNSAWGSLNNAYENDKKILNSIEDVTNIYFGKMDMFSSFAAPWMYPLTNEMHDALSVQKHMFIPSPFKTKQELVEKIKTNPKYINQDAVAEANNKHVYDAMAARVAVIPAARKIHGMIITLTAELVHEAHTLYKTDKDESGKRAKSAQVKAVDDVLTLVCTELSSKLESYSISQAKLLGDLAPLELEIFDGLSSLCSDLTDTARTKERFVKRHRNDLVAYTQGDFVFDAHIMMMQVMNFYSSSSSAFVKTLQKIFGDISSLYGAVLERSVRLRKLSESIKKMVEMEDTIQKELSIKTQTPIDIISDHAISALKNIITEVGKSFTEALGADEIFNAGMSLLEMKEDIGTAKRAFTELYAEFEILRKQFNYSFQHVKAEITEIESFLLSCPLIHQKGDDWDLVVEKIEYSYDFFKKNMGSAFTSGLNDDEEFAPRIFSTRSQNDKFWVVFKDIRAKVSEMSTVGSLVHDLGAILPENHKYHEHEDVLKSVQAMISHSSTADCMLEADDFRPFFSVRGDVKLEAPVALVSASEYNLPTVPHSLADGETRSAAKTRLLESLDGALFAKYVSLHHLLKNEDFALAAKCKMSSSSSPSWLQSLASESVKSFVELPVEAVEEPSKLKASFLHRASRLHSLSGQVDDSMDRF